MKVFKFGGASVKDPAGIKNLASIVSKETGEIVIVVSAFGKTTNAMEILLKSWLAGSNDYKSHLENIYSYHSSVVEELFPKGNPAKGKIDMSFALVKEYLQNQKRSGFDFEYDQVVSYGEIWSTLIVCEYLKKTGLDAEWIDIRGNIITDDRFRDANILWSETTGRLKAVFDFKKCRIYVTQGFIGGTISGHTTTLGREGSDYTAAIIANILDAESVTFWKDVPGLLNADPKWLNDARRLEQMSYREAVEMTFSGAKVIHPKTIKPLHNKNIPLLVKSFIEPSLKGTMVLADPALTNIIPVYIRKENQILISILPKDFSFAMGDTLSMVFQQFIQNGIKVNLVEASAISINVCVDDERPRVEALLQALKSDYSVIYNENVEMFTIRHYTTEALERISKGREILIQQRTRSTARFVARTTVAVNSK
jgi:aspartate kinase